MTIVYDNEPLSPSAGDQPAACFAAQNIGSVSAVQIFSPAQNLVKCCSNYRAAHPVVSVPATLFLIADMT